MSALSKFYSGTNRIADRVPDLAARIEKLSDADREAFEREMAVTAAEVFCYQNAQARAFATGRISQDEALTIYNARGGTDGGWRAGTSLALKVAVTMAVSELL